MAGIDDILTQTEEKSVAGKAYHLPNGLSIQHLNTYETDFVYHEIFEREIYLKHGISLYEGDCVFDVGANIGLFSLFVLNAYKNITVYAVEPSADLCGLIHSNTAAYHDHIKILQCGIAAENKEAIFSFYPGYSILSGFNTDRETDFHSLRAGLDNGQSEPSELAKKCLDKLAMEKLEEKKDYACQLKTISALIEEYDIQTINLLKIDIEKSEKEALQGIAEKDWDKIKQIVMEVHDSGGTELNEILVLLREKGYVVEVETEACLKGTGIVNLYAIHRSLSSRKELEIERKIEPDPANLSSETGRVAIAATFTADPLLPGLEFWGHELGWSFDMKFAPYNQVFQELLCPESSLSANTSGMNVLLIKWDDWLRYLDQEKIIKSSGKKFKTLTAKKKSQLKEAFVELLEALRSYSNHLPCFTMLLLCPSSPGYGDNQTFCAFFHDLELQLETHLKAINGIELLKAERFHSQYRVATIFDSVGDQVGHVPYTREYYHFLATLIVRRYYSLKNNPYKALVVDCDHTLWDGVCGENGPEGVKVEGVYAAFQRYLAVKAEAGYLLCLCSKNNEVDVWRVFQEQQGMILKKEHLADSRLNWLSKSENIRSLATGLNIGSDSFIFFDDNPVECAEVRAHCPEVFTVEWPCCADDDGFLNHLWMLDQFQVTEEDRHRKDSYRANAAREKLRENSYDFKDFLKNLKLNIMIEPVNDASFQRVAQLIARTNQFNFTGIRRTVAELQELLVEKAFQCWTVKVTDRFGDYGVVGAFIFKIADGMLAVDTFLLSCRVLGRGVEHKMMAQLGELARMHGLSVVKISYRKTPKNEPARLFLEQIAPESSGLNQQPQETEIIISVPELIACTLQPSNHTILSAKPDNAAESLPSASVSYENIRSKERLLCRIATELNNVKQLTEAIDGFYNKNNSAPIPAVLETTSATILEKDETWREEFYPQVLAGVKDIFARELRLTIDDLDERREFSDYFQHDSLKIVAITSNLSKEFPDIPPTLLFEQRNLEDVTRSIMATNHDILRSKYTKAKMSAGILEGQKTVAAAGFESIEDSAVVHDGIAIIGMNGRFPKASTIGQFWRNLRDGLSGIEAIPNERWDAAAFFDSKGKPGKTYCKWGGFLNDIDRFEASFFHISPREAETMDPQQRLFLEIVWGLLEDAGYTPGTMPRETGVYVGIIASDYGVYTNEAAVTGESGYRNADYYQIPNRVSYFFDFHGPSIAIDTACSGAGTALHLACQSLKRGECRTAIAGGVNLFMHPGRFIQYAQMQVLSKDDKCRPFGADATGTVYGEGIGAVLLKPLADAEKDGDTIYGVIKASAINSGGKTNGFTVPNPMAQAELISKALREAKIDSGTISYVEAHGTGTPLGDPIEIRGLTQAFQENSSEEAGLKPQYCALGSVKSNIGHLESSAAIAGLIKVLLQMKHRSLVPSLNSEQPNPMIRFEATPFHLQHRLEPWERPEAIIDGKRIVYPRRAGLSSFGAGGVNAHFIIEEYPAKVENNSGAQGLQLVVLSAQTNEKLMMYAAKMTDFLREMLTAEEIVPSLADMAYTLQTGREAMDERLAVIVSDVRDLISKLEDFCHDRSDGELIFNGHCRLTPVQPGLYNPIRRMGEATYHQLKCLAEYWVSGGEVDWKIFDDNGCRRRIPLPAYPFNGQRYLFGDLRKYLDQWVTRDASPKLHPLIDSNQSDFYEQSFVKNLSREDSFMKDHVVENQLVLPGVAYFEMARVAGNFSNRDRKVGRIRKMVWTRPVILTDQTKKVFFNLRPREDQVACKVWTLGEDGRQVVHAECNLEYEAMQENIIERETLSSIIHSCPHSLSGSECYQLLRSIGYQYGPSFQVIKELYYDQGQAISRLELQEMSDERIALYPSLLDGALQTITGWISRVRQKPLNPYVPFTVDEVQIYQPVTPVCYAWVSEVVSKNQGEIHIEKYDVKILGAAGELLVHIKDYYPRSFQKSSLTVQANDKIAEQLFFQWQWVAEAPVRRNEGTEGDNGYIIFDMEEQIRHALLELRPEKQQAMVAWVKPGEAYRELENLTYEINPENEADYLLLMESLKAHGWVPNKVIHLWSQRAQGFGQETLSSHLDLGLYSIQFLSKAILKAQFKCKTEIIYIFSSLEADVQPEYVAVGGMAGSIHCENPKLNFKIADIPTELTTAECILREIQTDENQVTEIKYRDNQRFVKRFLELDFEKETGTFGEPLLRDNGVYLMTGGLGGLGLIFARYLAKFKAKLVLTGRSALTSEKAATLKAMESGGSQLIYIQSDISQPEEVENLITEVKSKFGTINGIIHSAGVVKDSLTINKTKEETAEVIAPKVWGTVLLDQATREEKLDFFVMFSSTTSIIGHVGLSGYAYANRFLDEYVLFRENLHQQGLRFGKTMAINWPWWQEGGMRLDKNTENLLARAYGLRGLAMKDGLRVFEHSLNSGLTQFALIIGERAKVAGLFEQTTVIKGQLASADDRIDQPMIHAAELKRKLIHDLSLFIYEILKISPDEIGLNHNFSEFGFDSISFTQFSNKINETYDLNISPARFYEYQTMETFSGFLLQENPERFKGYYLEADNGLKNSAKATAEKNGSERASNLSMLPYRYLPNNSGFEDPELLNPRSLPEETVAIVGMGGIFPQCEDLESLWEHLVQGDCLITEVPKERWQWEEFYGDPQLSNKTDVKWGGFIRDVDKFDPLFFGISPREAALMDPQQRLFLETVYQAIEDAGYGPSALSGTETALFVGASINDYNELIKDYTVEIDPFLSSGVNNSMIANRVSYLLNIHGPSEVVDTACSSALVAIGRAVDCIRKGRCDLAIAGGVNVILRPKFHISFRKAGMLSPDGRCKTFDEAADGYVRGEGAGAIVLKPLRKATADRDHIYAVIKGVAENHGGHAQSLTAPNPKAQAELLVSAYNEAHIPIETVSYIEAHGTGTSLGDPIEINGLKQAFEKLAPNGKKLKKDSCGLGSVKTNIGHLECASGIAGVIKVLLALKYKQLPASVNFKKLNPYIDLTDTPFYIVTRTQPWETAVDNFENEFPRRAGVSSFGFGGTNAHVVLEEYPSLNFAEPENARQESFLIVLSACNEERLRIYAQKLAIYLDKCLANNTHGSKLSMINLAYTLQLGRDALNERLAVAASSIEEFQNKLMKFIRREENLTDVYRGNVKNSQIKSEFLFEGQEGQEFIKRIIAAGRMDQLAKLWVSGFTIDWNLLHAQRDYQRISLPTYPFAREPHWIIPKEPIPSGSIIQQARSQESSEVMYFYSSWEKEDFKVVSPNSDARWILLFGSNGKIKEAIIEKFQMETGHSVKFILAEPGECFRQTGEREYTINPLCFGDYLNLLTKFKDQQLNIGRIINLCPVYASIDFESPKNKSFQVDFTKHLMNFGIYVVFHLIRAIQEILPDSKLIMNTVYFSNSENANPFFKAIAGFSHSLKMIMPDISLSLLEIAEKNFHEELLAKIISKELLISDGVPEVRYCDEIRYVKKIQPLNMDAPAKPTLLRQHGVYLITGGMGGLGSLFARFLAEKYQARLILIGRSPLNVQHQKELDILKSYGADCLYLRSDIGNPLEMKRVMEKVRDYFGSLNGVIHAAGIIDQCNLFQKNLADFEKTLHPKLKGTEILDELTRDEPLDFFMAFSSIASILGDFGQCDYAVANRFLDSFVSFRENLRTQKLRQGRTISINWPLWQDGGMHFNADGERLYLQSSGMSYLKSEEGWESFIKILASGKTQVMVVSGINSRVKQFLRIHSKPEMAVVPIQSPVSDQSCELEMPLQPASAFVWENLKMEICQIISSITNIDQEKLDVEENLGSFGLDSITLKEFSTKLKTVFGVTVLPSVFFAYSSIGRICHYLLETHGDIIRNYVLKQKGPTEGEKVIFSTRHNWVEKTDASLNVNSVELSPNAVLVHGEPVAIIGAAGIFPGSKDLEEFWNHLELQHNLITEIPSSRWDWRLYFSKDKSDKNKSVSKWGAFIKDVDKFDAEFFNISRLEAESMDPQQRLFIQTVWKAIEDSGYKASLLSGKLISVFTGIQFNDYQRILESHGILDSHSGTGNAHAMISNRISYLFNFKGPSESIDTACSGSLVAVHQAVKSIQNGESEMAIAGGISLILTPDNHISASQLGVLSPDGSCKTFDKTANGYVKGEGIGAVLLKPLSRAIADHDHIYAVIKGTAVNHGGKAHSLTAPNSEAQADLLIAAYDGAKIDPGTVSYIEAHGTGTELGDPVEVEGLKKAFKKLSDKMQNPNKLYNYCGLGSLKTNIGHLEPAAGIAGLLKVILALKHRKLPGILHFHQLNPYIRLEHTPFYIVDTTQPWNQFTDDYENKIPRRAGVSSFGFGGTNAHIVLEEYEDLSTFNGSAPGRNSSIILLSAKKKQSLQMYAKEMAEYIKKQYTQHLQPAIDEKSGIQSLESELILLISEILTINNKECCLSDELSEYGFDRISLSEFTAKVNEKYQLDETPENFMNCGSINAISRYLLKQCGEKSSGDEPIENVTDDAIHLWRLEDIAYTLQVGREEMEERLAFVASSIEEAAEKLLSFSQGISQSVFAGNIKETKANLSSIGIGEEEQAYLHLLVKNNKLNQLAQLWVCGMKIDWEQIYLTRLPRRISLPTYPFAGESYWVPEISGGLKKKPEVIHPFIDRIDFDYSFTHDGFAFEKNVTANDWIMTDHKIWEHPIFPGVGYLEMVCAAASQMGNTQSLTLSNTLWLRPLEIQEFKQIRLFIKKEADIFHYEIRSTTETNKAVLHCQGDVSVTRISNENIQRISLDEIKARSTRRLDRETIYEKFSEIGLRYGKYFRGLMEVWGNDLEALGRISLPAGLAQDFSSFLLHPTLADGALQTAIGITSWSDLSRALVPFSVAKVEILHPLKRSGYAYVQFTGKNKFHVAMVDDNGQVCIKFQDVSVREIKNQISDFCYIPRWQEVPLVRNEVDPIRINANWRKVFIFYTSIYPELQDILVKHHEGDQVTSFNLAEENDGNLISDLEEESLIYFLGGINLKDQSGDDFENLAASQELGVLALFRLVKRLSDAGYDQKSLTFKVITNNVYPISNDECVRPDAAGLHGLIKAMVKEYPHWQVWSIDIDLSDYQNFYTSEKSKIAMEYISKLSGDARGNVTVIRGEQRYLRTLYPVQMAPVQKPVFRNKGVYLILGGAGGIGLELALYLAKEVQARLVLIGRSQLNPFQMEKIKQIESAGGKVMHIMADATNFEEMSKAISMVKNTFGEIHGAIHSAIGLRDKTIRNMDEDSFRMALAPKVEGSVILGKVLSGEKLDFMAFFSSAQSFAGNPGQSNYVAGCTFKDAFAMYLQTRLSCPVTIFNWGYWGTVGIAANQEYQKRFAMQGVKPIYPFEGMEIFKQALAHGVKQIVPLKADVQVLKEMGVDFSKRILISSSVIQQVVLEKQTDLPPKPKLTELKKTFSGKAGSAKNLNEQTMALIKNVFGEVLKIKSEDIDSDATFETYGMDSVFALEINGKLEKFFGKLSSTLLYENMTVEKLSQYFITNHLEDLQKILNSQSENEIMEDTESLFYDASAAMREPLEMPDDEVASDSRGPSVAHAPEESNIDNLSDREVDLLLKNFLEH